MKFLLTVKFRYLMTCLPVLPALLLFGHAHGLPVAGIYSERVPVANESDAERNRAFRNALEIVLVRATGEEKNLSHPAVQEALDNAQTYVEAIRYFSEAVTPTQVYEGIGLQSAQGGTVVEPSVANRLDEMTPAPGQR